jgi:hypothetical protein
MGTPEGQKSPPTPAELDVCFIGDQDLDRGSLRRPQMLWCRKILGCLVHQLLG